MGNVLTWVTTMGALRTYTVESLAMKGQQVCYWQAQQRGRRKLMQPSHLRTHAAMYKM